MMGLVWLGDLTTAIGVGTFGSLLAFGWPFLIDVPNPGTARRVMMATAVLTAVISYIGDVQDLAFLAGGVVIAGFLAEMFRRDGRPRLVEQISGTVSGGLLIVLTGLLVPTERLGESSDLFFLVSNSLGLALLATIPLVPHVHRAWMAFLGALVGSLTALVTVDVGILSLIIAALGAGAVVALTRTVLDRLPPAGRRRPALALAMVPACLSGPIAFAASVVPMFGS